MSVAIVKPNPMRFFEFKDGHYCCTQKIPTHESIDCKFKADPDGTPCLKRMKVHLVEGRFTAIRRMTCCGKPKAAHAAKNIVTQKRIC